jgi:predicted dehydrogenase
LILNNDRLVAIDLRSKPASGTLDIPLSQSESASSPVVSDFRWHQAVLEDFVAAVTQNKTPACDGHEGRRSLSVIEAIYRSAKNPNCMADV